MIKKKSLAPLPTLRRKADRALQDYYRAEYPEKLCESCAGPFELMHHAIEKSQSAGLRFEPVNLIFLCHGCHFRHHRTGDQMVMGNVTEGRGLAWWRNLKKLKLERKGWQLDRPFLEKQLEILTSKTKK